MELKITGDAPKTEDFTMGFTPLDETNSLLQIKFKSGVLASLRPQALVIGGKVFGYSDAPLSRGPDELSIALPTSFLITNPEVIVKPLLGDNRAGAKKNLLGASAENERLVYLTQDDTDASYLLFGRGLKDVKVVPDGQVAFSPVGTGEDVDTLRLVKIKLTTVKQLKQIILQRPSERPFLVSVPALPSASSSSTQSSDPKFQERVTVGSDEATIVGDGLNLVDSVVFGKTELTISDKSAKAIKLKGLSAARVTAVAKTQEITLKSKTGSTKITLEVVSQKVETVAK
jgi:hypothetical protein